jgi:hypothetical protein
MSIRTRGIKMPSVKTIVEVPKTKTRYVILAYRELTRAEAFQAIAMYNQSRDRRKSLKNKTITIVSTIGAS